MAERVTSVPLEVGLYVLRYVQTQVSAGAPQVFVRPSPGCERFVTVVTPPREQSGSIPAPGGCVVIRAEQAGSLHITLRSVGTGSTEAELRLESLSGETVAQPAAASFAGAAPTMQSTESLPKLELMGHVSRRGDVRVSDGRWVAGPQSPAPIEGLEARFLGEASGLTLEYQVCVGGRGSAWTPWTKTGFAGSRGQHRPLTGARFRLVGPRAGAFQLEAEALFLGAAVFQAKGQTIEVMSGSGIDPLVGLKIALNATQTVSRPQTNHQASQVQPSNAAAEPKAGRVRVFRSSGHR